MSMNFVSEFYVDIVSIVYVTSQQIAIRLVYVDSRLRINLRPVTIILVSWVLCVHTCSMFVHITNTSDCTGSYRLLCAFISCIRIRCYYIAVRAGVDSPEPPDRGPTGGG